MWEDEGWGWDPTCNRVFFRILRPVGRASPNLEWRAETPWEGGWELNPLIQQVLVCLISRFPGPFPTHSFSSCQQLCETDIILFLGTWKLKLREEPKWGCSSQALEGLLKKQNPKPQLQTYWITTPVRGGGGLGILLLFHNPQVIIFNSHFHLGATRSLHYPSAWGSHILLSLGLSPFASRCSVLGLAINYSHLVTDLGQI